MKHTALLGNKAAELHRTLRPHKLGREKSKMGKQWHFLSFFTESAIEIMCFYLLCHTLNYGHREGTSISISVLT